MYSTRIILLVLVNMLLISCNYKRNENVDVDQFEFKKIELIQKAPDQTMDWEFRSPESKYQIDNRTIKAKKPKIILYIDNQPMYYIKSMTSKLINDGEFILLDGNVRFQRVKGKKFLIKAQSMTWEPRKALVILRDNPSIEGKNIKIIAKEMRFDKKAENLDFIGKTTILFDNNIGVNDNTKVKVIAQGGSWNLSSGSIIGTGPIKGTNDELTSQYPTNINSKSIDGNLIDGHISLYRCIMKSDIDLLTADMCNWDWNNSNLIALDNVTYRRNKIIQQIKSDKFIYIGGKTIKYEFSSKDNQVKSKLFIDRKAN